MLARRVVVGVRAASTFQLCVRGISSSFPKYAEQKNRDNLSTLMGIADDLRVVKKVVIHRPIKASTQSAHKGGDVWRLEWSEPPKVLGSRWQNPTMGWTSTADPLSQLSLTFNTREAAIEFAAKNGWDYEVREDGPDTQYLHTEYFPGGGRAGGTFWHGEYGHGEDAEEIPLPKRK